MQGTLHAFDVPAITLRFIPARAGNTLRPQRQLPLPSAHPRSRGEHVLAETHGEGGYGSSPLARGTRYRSWLALGSRRLIPARAGSTFPGSPRTAIVSAHPRSCGEHNHRYTAAGAGFGSSPLARGTPQKGIALMCRGRLIPARAGNTQFSKLVHAAELAHPRSRGEHMIRRAFFPADGGSSPLARGTLTARRNTSPPKRLIPARAGNTYRAAGRSRRNSAHPRSRGEHTQF